MRVLSSSLLALGLVALLVWAAPALADTIHLKNGTVIKGRVIGYEDGEFFIRLTPADRHGKYRERMTVTADAVQRIDFGEEDTEAKEPEPQPHPGITLYVDQDFRGKSEVLEESDPDLRGNSIGNDRVTSVRVPPGYEVTLYSDVNYRGRSVELREDQSNLGRTALGNDALSSIRIKRDEPRPGVTLYVDRDFRGSSEILHESDPDLRDNSIGNDRVTSVRVPPGYEVTLYSDVNYRGRSVELREDESNLGRTTLGNDTLSSIRVEWVGMGRGR